MYFRPTRTILSATIFINWCCLNRKTLGYKKEPVMVYSFRENVPHLFLWFLWCHLLMKTKTRTTETMNNHTTSHWHSSINCKTLYLTSSEWINPYVIYLESNFFFINEDKNMPLFIINKIADFKQQTMNKQKQLHNILIAI